MWENIFSTQVLMPFAFPCNPVNIVVANLQFE